MPLQYRYTRDIAWHVTIAAWSFIVQKQGDLELQGLKESYITWQKQGIIWKISLTHKN